jgi:hypothetical protein
LSLVATAKTPELEEVVTTPIVPEAQPAVYKANQEVPYKTYLCGYDGNGDTRFALMTPPTLLPDAQRIRATYEFTDRYTYRVRGLMVTDYENRVYGFVPFIADRCGHLGDTLECTCDFSPQYLKPSFAISHFDPINNTFHSPEIVVWDFMKH